MTVALSSLDSQRQLGGKLVVALTWLLAVTVVAARLLVHGPLLGLAIAALATAVAATVANNMGGRGSTGRA